MKFDKKFDEEKVLKLLALIIPSDTPEHKLDYYLKKLYGFDSLGLDMFNQKILEKIKERVREIK